LESKWIEDEHVSFVYIDDLISSEPVENPREGCGLYMEHERNIMTFESVKHIDIFVDHHGYFGHRVKNELSTDDATKLL
jgi:hypothetical protein